MRFSDLLVINSVPWSLPVSISLVLSSQLPQDGYKPKTHGHVLLQKNPHLYFFSAGPKWIRCDDACILSAAVLLEIDVVNLHYYIEAKFSGSAGLFFKKNLLGFWDTLHQWAKWRDSITSRGQLLYESKDSCRGRSLELQLAARPLHREREKKIIERGRNTSFI